MRHILFLLFMALTLQAIAQYPATGNKMRLGWQTTGDGLIYRGAIGDTATLDPSGINNAWMLLDTSSGNLYAYRAKAWRLVSGGGGLTMPFNSVTFNVNETDASLRELKYSEEKGYLQYGGQDSVQIPILPGIWYVRNDTSVTIPKGTVLRATGTLGASGRIKVKHMIANGSIDAMYIIGIAMHDIAVGADGYAMSQGKIRQVNTQAYSEGAVLYADVDTLGGLTQTEPTGSNLKLPIAFVVHSASNGTLAVRVSPGTYLRDLHDVYITSPDSSASLYYNTSESVWRDTTAAALKSDISGTTNYLPKFTGSSSVGNSVVYETGSKIGIGNIAPETALDVSGSIRLRHTGSTGGGPIEISDRSSTLSQGINWNVYWDGATWKYRNTDYGALLAFNNVGDIAYLNTASGTAGGSVTFSERFRVKQDGTFGIGTNSPSRTLDVNGIGRFRQSGGSGGGPIEISDRSSANNQSINWNIYYDGSTWRYRNSDYGASLGFTSTGNFTFANIATGTAEGAVTFRERFTITDAGNVGIATASPSRPLHVAGTTAIRIPVGTTSDRGTSANGDIRYNTTNANFEWYSGTGWREPVNAARSPAVGLANRFSKFDANGLLDTSAVLTQSANRIGIGTASPTAGFMLDVVGGDARINGMTVGLGGSNVGSNLAFGNGALASWDTTGTGTNVAIGAFALNAAKGRVGFGASSNLAIGGNALRVNTNTANNVAIGADAMRFYNKTGAGAGGGNVAIGGGALYYLEASASTPVANNVAIGLASMLYTQNSDANACIGTSSMRHAQGNDNVAIGQASLASSDPGTPDYRTGISQNVSIGASAMQNIVANTTGNIAIGKSALGLSNYEGDNGVYIGLSANASSTTATNEIVIGANTTGNGSNTTTIGNSSTTHTVLQYGETLLGYAASGDVGDYRVQVNGNGYVSGEFRIGYTADQGNYPLQVNGQIFATNATIATSDARLKQDIEPLKSGLKEVLSLNPVTYTFKPDTVNNYPKGKQVGFLAQEIKATVQGDYAGSIVQEAGGYLGVADTKLIPLLVKAIQEQQAQIEALKKEIEALKNK